MSRVVLVLLGFGGLACGSSSRTSDPAYAYDCSMLASAWRDEVVAALDACDRPADCTASGAAAFCEQPSIDCGVAVNALAYHGSRAELLASLFTLHACGETVTDCDAVASLDCVSHRCVINYLCCHDLPPDGGPDAATPDAAI